MAKRRKAEVQYKETEVFELFPALEYTKQQKQRLILFHAYARNIRRIINYAAHFDKRNQICMVYIVGEVAPEKIQKLLADADCSDRVCVLTSAFPAKDMDFWRDFDEMRKRLIKSGNWDDERQNVTAEWLHIRDIELWWKEQLDAAEPDIDGQMGFGDFGFSEAAIPDCWRTINTKNVTEHKETLDAIARYHALAKKAPSYFRRWTLHRRGQKPRPFRHADTDKLIAKIYPYGAEARGVTDYAALSPASIDPAVKLMTEGAGNWRLGFDRAFAADFAPIREIRDFVADALAAKGYVTFSELADYVKGPPWGLAYNGYSAAILCAALVDIPDLLYFDSLTDSPLQEAFGYFCKRILPPKGTAYVDRTAFDKSCLYKEYSCHAVVRAALTDLYGLSAERTHERYVIVYSRAAMESLFRLPMSMTDDLLFRLTGPDLVWHDRAQMERLAAEVTARRDELPRVLAAHIARDKRIPYRGWIPSAACWLWKRETMLDAPHCMMTPEEQARLEMYQQQHYEAERRKQHDVDRAIWAEADKESLAATFAYRDYLQDREEPCKRRLLALCGSGS